MHNKLTLPHSRPEPDAIARISIVEMVQFAFDIASALEYIELKNYVHRDVAARNCLGMCSLAL